MAQVVDHMPSKNKALSSNSSTAKQTKTTKPSVPGKLGQLITLSKTLPRLPLIECLLPLQTLPSQQGLQRRNPKVFTEF
jgi:hypothetical protein